MELSKRLSLICDMVQPGSMVCDVGTDHGFLPAFLYVSGKCKSVCATDIKEKPLAVAKKNIEAAGAFGVRLYLCDGLDAITRDMADTVVIAGIGGEVISGIIDRAPFLHDETVTLILQPTTSANKLREYLASNGFVVVRERAVEENGKLYSVMAAHFCGIPYPIDDLRAVAGVIKPDYPEGRAYLTKQYNVIKKRIDELESTGKNRSLYINDRKTAEKLLALLGKGEKNGV